jgi:hypothetical protein
MSDKTRESLPEVALGSAVLAADTARGWVKRAASAGARTIGDRRDAALGQVQTTVRSVARAMAPKIIDCPRCWTRRCRRSRRSCCPG